MIKHGYANPLAVFGLQTIDHCPPHFQKVCFELEAGAKAISDWLYENTDGRFFMGNAVDDDGANKFCVGFENHVEATLFALQLTEINVANSSW